MKITVSTNDESALVELGARFALARLERNLTQAELADQAGVSKRTVERMEAGNSIQLSSLVRVCRALGLMDGLNSIVPETAPSPVELLKLGGKKRRRASAKKETGETAKEWTWGDDQ